MKWLQQTQQYFRKLLGCCCKTQCETQNTAGPGISIAQVCKEKQDLLFCPRDSWMLSVNTLLHPAGLITASQHYKRDTCCGGSLGTQKARPLVSRLPPYFSAQLWHPSKPVTVVSELFMLFSVLDFKKTLKREKFWVGDWCSQERNAFACSHTAVEQGFESGLLSSTHFSICQQ